VLEVTLFWEANDSSDRIVDLVELLLEVLDLVVNNAIKS
jgi:hypothetical protein